jgi:hypothetical protein
MLSERNALSLPVPALPDRALARLLPLRLLRLRAQT